MMNRNMTHTPTRRLLAGVVALCVLFSTTTGVLARGIGPVGNLGMGLEDLLDPVDVLPPTGANLPVTFVGGVEFAQVINGDPPPGLVGMPSGVTMLPPVLGQNGLLMTPLQGVTGDGLVGGRAAQPGVLTPQGAFLLPPLVSLKSVAIPTMRGLEQYVSNRGAAILLGKALFWDAQVGSDGQACASCHFHAGADNRMKNQLNPGLRAVPSDTTFSRTFTGAGGPNYTLKAADFPFHRLADPIDRNSAVLFDSNDVVSSQGTFGGPFTALVPGSGTETCANRLPDPNEPFKVNGVLTRRVEPRNTPTVINAVFNYRNFWDGRANNVFNGVNPFGNRDPNAKILALQPDGSTAWVKMALPNASLASQAVGPALSNFEMSCDNKAFKDLGRKMLSVRPLAGQVVDPKDSVLAGFRHPSGLGLKTTYAALIKQAFDPKWWAATAPVGGYSQMENNFSMFWGLAVMMYESTLVSDDAPIDRLVGSSAQSPNPNALSAAALRGLALFRGKGECVACHKGAEFTGAATALQPDGDAQVVEHMFSGDGQLTLYDSGFYNIGVRAATEDLGVGAIDPFGKSWSFSREYLTQLGGASVPDSLFIDPCLFSVVVDVFACWTPPEPTRARVSVDGAFKTPSLRNVALTQPYFHNGSRFTLEQVVEFYNRGGDRRDLSGGGDTSGYTPADGSAPNGANSNFHPHIHPLGLSVQEKADLVAFLRTGLTDVRVACEQAPFDHPSLRLFNGQVGDETKVVLNMKTGRAMDAFLDLPAVGSKGRSKGNCYVNDNGTPVVQ